MSGVQSIERAFRLLRALAIGPAGVTELADRADLPKSTVARLLGALESERAVEQVEAGGRYRLGIGLADLAGAASPGPNLITAARPHLLDLRRRFGEASGVAVLDDDAVLFLDHVDSAEEVQVRSWTGQRVPLHLTPSGLVLLGAAPPDYADEYLAKPLNATTERSVIDPNRIRARLADAARDGYAWAFGEFDEEVNSVAAPVRNETGEVIAAIHVHGPAYRFPGEDSAPVIGRQLDATAQRLTTHLG